MMLLKSIQVQDTGALKGPIHIDGLGPGLNLLTGRNEAGKSTLLRALLALFQENHRTSRQALKQVLQPYEGGAPQLECVFEEAGTAWRLSKRFFSAPRAELVRLDGRETWQGADAEGRLQSLLGGDRGFLDAMPLLWVTQETGDEVPAPGAALHGTMGDLLANEALAASGAARAMDVLAKVEAELGRLVTEATGRPRTGGPYAQLLLERDRLRQAHRDAAERMVGVHRYQEELSRLQAEERELADAEAERAEAEELTNLERELADARQARTQAAQLAERVRLREEQKAQCEEVLGSYDRAVQEVMELEAGLQRLGDELAVRAEAAMRADGERAAAARRCDAAAAVASSRAAELDLARAQAAISGAQARYGEIKRSVALLDEIEAGLESVSSRLAEMTWPEQQIEKARTLKAEIAELEARHAAVAPKVSVAYVAGVSGGFRANGRALADGASLDSADGVVIEVPGIGEIRIAPADGEEARARQEAIAERGAALVRVLAAFGAVDMASAEARERDRAALRQERAILDGRQLAVAPEGRTALIDEGARLHAQLAGVPPANGPPPDLEALADARWAATAAFEAAQADLKSIKAQIESDQREVAKLEANREAMERRRRELECALPAAPARDSHREAIAEAVAAAHLALSEAVREQSAWREKLLDPAILVRLEAETAQRRSALGRRAARLSELRQELRRIEGRLASEHEAGFGATEAELAGRLALTDIEISDLESRVAALALLRDELRNAVKQHYADVAGPLRDRLQRTAGRLWPGASLRIADDLAAGALVRGGRDEAPQRISTGTREQVAVLARLAYAELLADHGRGGPIILDDPFVYADDERLERLFGILGERADQGQQILVLSCHANAFAPLVGRYGAEPIAFQGLGTAGEYRAPLGEGMMGQHGTG